MEAVKLSIIILTKNSESTIADCIESIKGLGSEIIVIDSESEDRTTQIAERFGAKVVVHPFKDFSSQRNFALQKAREEWVLYLDSDEQATPEFIREVSAVVQNHEQDSGVNGYFITRRIYYFGKDWGVTDKVQRLFYKKQFIEWYGVVHETPKIKGTFGQIESPIFHFTHRNLSQMIAKTNEWSEKEADLRYKSHHPKMSPWRFFRVMITAFINSYIGEKGYKNGTAGIIEAIYQSFSMFITYAKLWEKQQR